MFSSTMDWRTIDLTHVVVHGAPYPPRRASALPARSIGRQNTKGFKNSELLGAGGFGKVCRGVFGFSVLPLETWRAGTVPTHRPRHRRQPGALDPCELGVKGDLAHAVDERLEGPKGVLRLRC